MRLKMDYVKILGFQSNKNLDSKPLSYNTMFYINVRKFVTNFNTIWDCLFVRYRMHSFNLWYHKTEVHTNVAWCINLF